MTNTKEGGVYDLVVIGGGLTGLNAAWDCQKAGKSVLVLEARDRVGGRTLTTTEPFVNGEGERVESHFDLGAHFIGHEIYQSDIWNLVLELGLTPFPQYEGWSEEEKKQRSGDNDPYWYGEGANILRLDEGPEAYIGNTIPPTPAGQQYLGYLMELIGEVPLQAPHTMPNAEKLDRLSVMDWAMDLNMPGFGKPPLSFLLLTRMLCRVGFSAEPEEISALWFLFYLASSGGFTRFQSIRWPTDGAQGYRLKEGAQSISLALAERLQAKAPECIKLGQPVASVKDDRSKGTVTIISGSGEVFRGKKALIAMAPILCNRLKFDPPLTPERVQAGNNMGNSHMVMSYVTFDKPFWRDNTTMYPSGTVNGLPTDHISRYGLSGDILMATGPIVWMLDNTSGEEQAAMFAFIVGKEAKKLPTPEQRREAVLREMTDLLGPEVAKHNPVYHEKDWNLEEFSDGCPASHFAPGTFVAGGQSVLLSGLGHEPFGNVFFASTESATISNGYMDGAVWSGQQVAIDIRRALGDEVPKVTRPLARSLQMEACVKTVLKAIEQQNPMLEEPVLAQQDETKPGSQDMVFHGPGGTTLPTNPPGAPDGEGYVGMMGTVQFYTLMASKISLSCVAVESISIDVENNRAYATWNAQGHIVRNGNPFRDVKGTILFEFTDPGLGAALIQKEWMFMDVELVDKLHDADPGSFSGRYDENLTTRKAHVEKVTGIGSTAAKSLADAKDHMHAEVIVYGPGGPALPRGPFMGEEGILMFQSYLSGLNHDSQLVATHLDKDAMTFYSSQMIQGKSQSGNEYHQPLVVVIRMTNTPEPKIAEIRYVTDGLALA